jgi:hypothetical protein
MKDFIQREQNENMTVEEAAAIKISFGKQKGKTLGEIYKVDHSWIDWYKNADKKDPVIIKAIEILENVAKQAREKKQEQKQEDQLQPVNDDDDAELPWNKKE